MRPHLRRTALAMGLCPLLTCLAPPALAADDPPSPEVAEALDHITADSLRGHLFFLASDLLEGRGTPSRGLDLAALYIAAQFRRAGLEPIGDDGYFQTAEWPVAAPAPGDFECNLTIDGRRFPVGERQVSARLTTSLQVPPSALVKLVADDPEALAAVTTEAVRGKVVLVEIPHPDRAPRQEINRRDEALAAFLDRLADLAPALVVIVDPDSSAASGLRTDRAGPGRPTTGPPRLTIHSPLLAETVAPLPAGPVEGTLSLHVGAPKEGTVPVRNVVGLLRGSDPALKETYVLVSAHYDHLGLGPRNPDGDAIYNGANDDGSGTVSVIELASALATLQPRPKRSIVFITFYGEEHGMVGSRYYADHPVVPLDRTVAAVNLEQVGRTDDNEGPRVAAATVTGFDYSDVGPTLRSAGERVGIAVSKHPRFSDQYFVASDNLPLARKGIPAHTVSVAFAYPDYHGADDEWERVDYDNMAQVDRMVALGLITLADAPEPPTWDADNPRTEPYRAARNER